MDMLYSAIGMSLATGVIYAVTLGAQHVYGVWQQRRTVSLRIEKGQQAWDWFMAWMEEDDQLAGRTMKRRVQHVRLRPRANAAYGFMPNDASDPIRFMFRGRLFRLVVTDESNKSTTLSFGMADNARLVAIVWTRGTSVDVFHGLLDEMKKAFKREHATSTGVMVPALEQGSTRWVEIRRCHRRKFEHLVLSPALCEAMRRDLEIFAREATRDRYEQLCIPYRRTWLLHGPPGNGKSSCAFAVADALSAPIRLLSLSDPKLSDAVLADLINVHPLRARPDGLALIVLEDADALFVDRAAAPPPPPGAPPTRSSVTLSGLLNVLDGAPAPEYTVIIMTTNYPDRLDAALTRSGRVDCRFEFGPPTDEMIKRMLARFVPDSTAGADAFVALCREDTGAPVLSMARVQELARQQATA